MKLLASLRHHVIVCDIVTTKTSYSQINPCKNGRLITKTTGGFVHENLMTKNVFPVKSEVFIGCMAPMKFSFHSIFIFIGKFNENPMKNYH